MRRSLANFSESEASNHTPSFAAFTTATPELKVSVHTGLATRCRHELLRESGGQKEAAQTLVPRNGAFYKHPVSPVRRGFSTRPRPTNAALRSYSAERRLRWWPVLNLRVPNLKK